MDQQLKQNLVSGKHWSRLAFMVLFAIFIQVASIVMGVVVVLQFVFAVITGQDNLNLRRFGDVLSQFIFQCLQFLTYVSDEKPFPFAEWPVSDIVEPIPSDNASDYEAVIEDDPIEHAPVKENTDTYDVNDEKDAVIEPDSLTESSNSDSDDPKESKPA